MDLEIDPRSAVPIYQQIRDRIVEAIAIGELRLNDPLPSVRSLAASFGINPNTVVKAYDLLRSEGFVAASAKSGTFVSCDPMTGEPDVRFLGGWHARLFTLLAEARARGVSLADLDHLLGLTTASLAPVQQPGEADGPAADGAKTPRGDASGETARPEPSAALHRGWRR